MLLVTIPVALSDNQAPIDGQISKEEKAKFDEILKPVMKIYNFIKYIVTIVAAIMMLFAGITFMTSGSDPRKRDQAKNIATYCVAGLILIWATPFVIGLLI